MIEARRRALELRLWSQGRAAKLHQAQVWQYLDPEAARALQRERLVALLEHAGRHVPYYRDLLRRFGVAEKGRLHLERFVDLPLLDKPTIRRSFETLKSDDLRRRRWYYNYSGGSSGEPIRLIQDQGYADWAGAMKLLFDEWTGRQVGDRQVRLWGSERDLLVGHETPRVRAARWLRNELWLNAFRMTPARMRDYVQRINRFRPRQILAYPTSMYELSRFVEREGIDVHSPQAVMTSGTALEPEMRSTIERVWATRVFDRYGSREVGDIACECREHKGLHVSLPCHYVEVLRADGSPVGPGEPGELVVTSLTNYAMPLVRYRIGDMAEVAGERCGRGVGWPLIKSITGRISSIFVTMDGALIPGGYFGFPLWDRPWIQRFQVVQESRQQIVVRVVGDPTCSQAPSAAELDDIVKKYRAAVGASCQVTFDFVDEIETSPTGKHQPSISHVTERHWRELSVRQRSTT